MNQMTSMQHETEPLSQKNLPVVQSLENQYTVTSDQPEHSKISE